MKYLTVVTFVLLATLACTGTESSTTAEIECALPDNANSCESCLYAACNTSCKTCVDDPTCLECTQSDDPSSDCMQNPLVAQLVGCVVGNCIDECTQAPSRNPRQRLGRGRKGGGGGAPPAGGGGGGGGGGGEGKIGKGKRGN